MALDKPTLKMSKSHVNPKSRILLTDSREEIQKKLRVALTDSIQGVTYDSVGRPGVSNLVDIAFHLDPFGADSAEELGREFAGLSLKALKDRVATTIDAELAPIRERFDSILRGTGKELDDAAAIGAGKASRTARKTMEAVRSAVGF